MSISMDIKFQKSTSYNVLRNSICFVIGFDLSKNQDVSTLLDILENGAISDVDEESDDEIIQHTSQNVIRVGSNSMHPNGAPYVIDNFDVEEDLQEEVIPEEEPKAGPSNKKK